MITLKASATVAATLLLLSLSSLAQGVGKETKTKPANSTPSEAVQPAISDTKTENTSTAETNRSSDASKTDASKSTAPDATTTTTTTPDATKSTPQEQPGRSSSAGSLPDHITPTWEPAKIIPDKPVEKPAPAGQAAAVKLYTARKFAPAAAQFEKLIKDGSANVETHAYLAYCEYSQRHYTKALRQFDWVAKNSPTNYKLRTSAERSSSMLRTQMSGICPNQCLKANDSRWARDSSGKRWIRWSIPGGWVSISDSHIGQVAFVRNGELVNQGVCPTCGGTGTLPPLHDGDPLPR